MTTDEIIRLYNAKPLKEIDDPVIIININKKYQRGSDTSEIYNATKQSWRVSSSRIQTIKYALSEYEGIIIEVYKINDWYQINNRWGFNGEVAEDLIRSKYINKSIAHTKKKGSANPIRYTI